MTMAYLVQHRTMLNGKLYLPGQFVPDDIDGLGKSFRRGDVSLVPDDVAIASKEKDDAEAGSFDPATRDDIQDIVNLIERHPEQLERVYALESEGLRRLQLLTWLEAQIEVSSASTVEDDYVDAGVTDPEAEAEAEAEEYDPSEHPVAEVLAYVEANPGQLEVTLEAERTGKDRTTLVTALEERLTAPEV